MKIHVIKIEKGLCKSCELCVVECKQKIIDISKETNKMGYHPIYIKDEKLCTGCTLCAIACPDSVIEIYQKEE
ncbi:MAG TPA: 4Fe-4S dicluster domain-containing protein [Spirochaetota bacterium]|nr:4Fe-4S dicluster domain-containing protein [Spirochaetota bacterium]